MSKPKYVRISLHGGSGYVQPVDKLAAAWDGELDDADVGDKWTVEVVDITDEEYKQLPDFAGH